VLISDLELHAEATPSANRFYLLTLAGSQVRSQTKDEMKGERTKAQRLGDPVKYAAASFYRIGSVHPQDQRFGSAGGFDSDHVLFSLFGEVALRKGTKRKEPHQRGGVPMTQV
jgi:hypothetical protein